MLSGRADMHLSPPEYCLSVEPTPVAVLCAPHVETTARTAGRRPPLPAQSSRGWAHLGGRPGLGQPAFARQPNLAEAGRA